MNSSLRSPKDSRSKWEKVILASKLFPNFLQFLVPQGLRQTNIESNKIARKSIYDIFKSYFLYYCVKHVSTFLMLRDSYINEITVVNCLKKISSPFNTFPSMFIFSKTFIFLPPHIPYIWNANDIFTTHHFWCYLWLMSFLVLEKIDGNRIWPLWSDEMNR